MLRTVTPPPYEQIFDTIIGRRVPVVETAGNVPAEVFDRLVGAGITVIHKCTSVGHALTAEKRGVHIVSTDGFEYAGHPGEDDVPGLVLIPAAVQALSAQGVNMGTRFVATQEAPVHEAIKQALVQRMVAQCRQRLAEAARV